MIVLYPHLPLPAALDVAERVRRTCVEDAAELAAFGHPAAVYTATGGSRINEDGLSALRNLLLELARQNGYPDNPVDHRRLAFDAATAVEMYTRLRTAPAEAAKPGMWAFLCCVLAPDIVRWRFPGGDEGSPVERFLPGRRNTLQRLWWRAAVLERASEGDPFSLLRELGEDEIVQIMERPNLAGCRRLSVAMAEAFLEATRRAPHIPRRLLVREAQKRIMRLSSFLSFDGMEDKYLRRTADEVFDRVVAAIHEN